MSSIGRSLGALQTRMSQGRIFLAPKRRISCLSLAGLVSLPESPLVHVRLHARGEGERVMALESL